MPGFGGLGVNRRVIFCMPEGANYYGRRLTVVDYDFLKIAAIIFPIPHVLPEPCYFSTKKQNLCPLSLKEDRPL